MIHFGCKSKLSTFFVLTVLWKCCWQKRYSILKFIFFQTGSPTSISITSKNQLYRIRLCDHSFCSSMRAQEKLKCNMCSKLNIFTIMSLANTYITFPSVSHHVWIHSSYINITHVYFWLFWLSQGLLWVFWQKEYFHEGYFYMTSFPRWPP